MHGGDGRQGEVLRQVVDHHVVRRDVVAGVAVGRVVGIADPVLSRHRKRWCSRPLPSPGGRRTRRERQGCGGVMTAQTRSVARGCRGRGSRRTASSVPSTHSSQKLVRSAPVRGSSSSRSPFIDRLPPREVGLDPLQRGEERLVAELAPQRVQEERRPCSRRRVRRTRGRLPCRTAGDIHGPPPSTAAWYRGRGRRRAPRPRARRSTTRSTRSGRCRSSA